MAKNLLLLALALLLCYAAAELVFYVRLAPERSLPLVKFRTERKHVALWTYDDYFNSVADYDLRGDIPSRN